MAYFLHLLWRHLRQYPGRALAATLTLFVAATLMLALASAGALLQFRLGSHLAKLFPEQRLQLEAARGGFGPLALEPKPITGTTVRQAAARPEARQVWPVESVRFPVRVEGNLFGTELSSDAVIHGVPRELVADALRPDQPWSIPADPLRGEYPVVVSNYLLDMYNLGLARASGLPMLNAQYVLGKHATLVLGESTVGLGREAAQPRAVRAVAAGISRQPALLGLALPADAVRQFNREFAPNSPPQYVQLIVLLRPGADRASFLSAVRPLGLVEGQADVNAGRVLLATRAAGWALMGLAAAVLGLGMLTFYMLFAMLFHARRLDLIRLRALGATPGYAAALALGEVAAQAGGAIALAAALNWLLLAAAERRLAPWLAGISSLPPDLLRPSAPALIFAALAMLIITLLPALAMLRGACLAPPARWIRDL